MNLDDLGREWRATNEVAATQEQRDRLIAVTCRRVERFWGQIVRRDLIETVVAVVLIFVFGRMVISLDDLISKVGAGIVLLCCVFIIWKLHRARTVQRPAPIDAPVRDFCRIELDRLDRQIRLLGGVLWWYIAPILVGADLVYVGSSGLGIDSLFYVLFTVLLGWFILAMNRLTVTGQLKPLHEEVAGVLSQLEGTRSDTLSPRAIPEEHARRCRRLGVVWFAVFAVLGLVGAYVASQEVDYPKRAPFSGIRWERSDPVVKVGEEWVTLVSVDGVATGDIVAFSQRRYLLRWKKRFAEDLVEVLARMGHEPGATVRLVVRPLGSPDPQTLEDVPMTEGNRRDIYRAARAGEGR
ncbi:MAG: hypothetical protein ACT4QC_12750 [Planctomycetaceae bacterium]